MQPTDGAPRQIRELTTWIPLSDGTRLSARLWLPADAEAHPVPAILEAVPYRKSDMTAHEDSTRHPQFARCGYAAARLDIRGSGDSEGVLLDEYLAQEQRDNVEVIAWLAEQPWCSGRVGMMGYSWGGISALQAAALRPPQLGAIITAYSTDDRYLDDCHHMGGCVLASDLLKWSTMMRAWSLLPPDPRVVGESWREQWLDRISHMRPFADPWLSHQRRDAYWRQGSVAEDHSAIEAATLIIGGWTDPYTNAAVRMLERLSCPRRAIIGPWGHTLPHHGIPGPSLDFIAECVRWFDRWLKDEPNGVDSEPMLSAFMPDSRPPAEFADELPGRWVEAPGLPCAEPLRFVLGSAGSLDPDVPEGAEPSAMRILGDQAAGEMAGVWCANGLTAELPADQRADDARSLVFDSAVLAEPLEILGVPVVRLRVASDKPLALLAARVTDVAPDGASTLVTWGQLNLAHRDGHDSPQPLEPGREYDVTLSLGACAHRYAAGHRIRLALSPTNWPHAWPSPQPAELTIWADGPGALELPATRGLVPERSAAFPPPKPAGLDRGPDAIDERTRTREFDPENGMHAIRDLQRHVRTVPGGVRIEIGAADDYEITAGAPLSAEAVSTRSIALTREDWNVRVEVDAELICDAEAFMLVENVATWDGDELVFSREERRHIPRDLL